MLFTLTEGTLLHPTSCNLPWNSTLLFHYGNLFSPTCVLPFTNAFIIIVMPKERISGVVKLYHHYSRWIHQIRSSLTPSNLQRMIMEQVNNLFCVFMKHMEVEVRLHCTGIKKNTHHFFR